MYPSWLNGLNGDSSMAQASYGVPSAGGAAGVSKPTTGISLIVKFGQFFGYCPINIESLRTKWLVRIWSWILFAFQIPLCFDIAMNLINKTETLAFFSDYSVIAILHLSVALHGALSMALNVFQGEGWRNLIHSLRQQPNTHLSKDCRKSENSYCIVGMFATSLGSILYFGYLAVSVATSTRSYVFWLNLQHFLTITSVATPVIIFMVVAQHLRMHFRTVKNDFLHKFHSTPMKKFSLLQARDLNESFIRLTAAMEALNGVFTWNLACATAGWIVTGTFEAYMLVQSGVPMGPDAIHVLWLVTVQQACCIAMFVQGAKLNSESKLLRKEILLTSPEKYDDPAKETIDRLVQYIDDSDWGLSVGGFFRLDTSSAMTIVGLIFSHTLILVELGVYVEDTAKAERESRGNRGNKDSNST